MKKFLFWFAVAEWRQAETHIIVLGFVQKKLEFQPKGTANSGLEHSREKMRRREAPMIGLNSRQTQTPPRFSTLRVAPRCQCKIQISNIEHYE